MKSIEQVQLALVQAPAGFGKTTVMLDWSDLFSRQGAAIGWLTLDAGDNDAGRFLSYLAGAVQSLYPDLPLEELLGGSEGEAPNQGAVLMNLLDTVSRLDFPFAIFLDDFESIKNPDIENIVKQLIDVLPPEGVVVIGTRRAPGIGLGRLRAMGWLVEIGEKELRFTPGEMRRYLSEKRNLLIDSDDIDRINFHIEGWAAGLQLVALACMGVENPSEYISGFKGSTAEISEYLGEDVFSRQPEDVQRFLLQTSILERLCAPLCDAVSASADGYEMLERLEKSNLFLMPLGSDKRWYRYHSVFLNFLRERLERDASLSAGKLHIAAAAWLEKKGFTAEAISHLIRAGEAARALALIEEVSQDLVLRLGQADTLIKWVGQVDSRLLGNHPLLMKSYAWALALSNRFREVEVVLDQLRDKVEDTPQLPGLQKEVAAISAMMFMFCDKVEQGMIVAEDALNSGKFITEAAQRTFRNIYSFSLMIRDDFEQAEKVQEKPQKILPEAGPEYGLVYSVIIQGMLSATQGKLSDATAKYRSAMDTAHSGGMTFSVPATMAAIMLADSLYQRGELSEAQGLLEKYLPLFDGLSLLGIMAIGYRTLARIYLVREKTDKAFEMIDAIERIGRERQMPRFVATASLERMRIHLAGEDLKRALETETSWGDASNWSMTEGVCMPENDPETLEIGRLRMLLAKGGAKEALSLLKAALDRAVATGRFRQEMKLRLLTVKALEEAGERKLSLQALQEAIIQGSREGYVQTVVEEGRELSEVLLELRRKLEARANEPDSHSLLVYLGKIINGIGETYDIFGKAAPVKPRVARRIKNLEELTEREQEVLELLAAGMSNEEIADKLFVSYPTVSFHLRNINSKLGSKNRIQAVALARKKKLIA